MEVNNTQTITINKQNTSKLSNGKQKQSTTPSSFKKSLPKQKLNEKDCNFQFESISQNVLDNQIEASKDNNYEQDQAKPLNKQNSEEEIPQNIKIHNVKDKQMRNNKSDNQIKIQLKQHQRKDYTSSQSVQSPNNKRKMKDIKSKTPISQNNQVNYQKRDSSKNSRAFNSRKPSNVNLNSKNNQQNNIDAEKMVDQQDCNNKETLKNVFNYDCNDQEQMSLLNSSRKEEDNKTNNIEVIIEKVYESSQINTKNYLEHMKDQYGISTRNSIANSTSFNISKTPQSQLNNQARLNNHQQLSTSQSVTNFLNINNKQNLTSSQIDYQLDSQDSNDVSQNNIDLQNINTNDIQLIEQSLNQVVFKRQRTSHTPNHTSYNKSRQLGFFNNGDQKSTFYKMSMLDANNNNALNDQQNQQQERASSFSMNRRSISKQRRINNNNINDEERRQSFLQECASIQVLSWYFISILNKIRKTQDSPLKKSMTQVELQNAINIMKVLKIQKWYRKRQAKKLTLYKIKILSQFKTKLLATYRGWLVRNKLNKNENVQKQVKLIKFQRGKLYQLQNINMKNSKDKQSQIKQKIRENIVKLIKLLTANSNYNSIFATRSQSVSKIQSTSNYKSKLQFHNEKQPMQSQTKQRKYLNKSVVKHHQFTNAIEQVNKQSKIGNICQSPQPQQKHQTNQSCSVISLESSPQTPPHNKFNQFEVTIIQLKDIQETFKDVQQMSQRDTIIHNLNEDKSVKGYSFSKSRYLNSKTPTGQSQRLVLNQNEQSNLNINQSKRLSSSNRSTIIKDKRQLNVQKQRIAKINREISNQRMNQTINEEQTQIDLQDTANFQEEYLDCDLQQLNKLSLDNQNQSRGLENLKPNYQNQICDNEIKKIDQNIENQNLLLYNETLKKLQALVSDHSQSKEIQSQKNDFELYICQLRENFDKILNLK